MAPLAPIDRSFPPDLRVCSKALDGVQNGGLYIDVYAPERDERNSRVPLALYLHGGAWILGASSSIPYREVRWWRDRGVAVASVEYRMLPHVTMKEIREDVLDGYRFVQDGLNSALEEQGWSVDGTRVSAWGASAGGGSVIFLGADVLTAGLPPLCAVVPVYPVADFLAWGRQRTRADWDALLASNAEYAEAYSYLMERECVTGQLWVPQGTPEEPPLRMRNVFAAAAMQNDLLITLLVGDAPYREEESPLGVLCKDYPPTFVIVACEDDLIPPSQSYDVVKKLKALGVHAEAGECIGMGHGQIEVHQSNEAWPEGVTWWETAVEPGLNFVHKYLKA